MLLAVSLSSLPLTSLQTYNGQSYTWPVDAPKNLTATMDGGGRRSGSKLT